MIPIQKGIEPEGLAKLREKTKRQGLSPKEAFKKLKNPLKDKVRSSLVKEQGGICAYCMCRIPRSDVENGIAPIIIEHFVPRDPVDGRDVGQGLDYNNLFAVCHGNRASKGKRTIADLTCDAHRENIEFRKINPCVPETLASIYYTLDGKIHAYDEDVKVDLLNTLNLNCSSSPLIAERKAALDSLIADLGEIPEEDLMVYCNDILTEFLGETEVKTPYVGILIWYLRDMVGS